MSSVICAATRALGVSLREITRPSEEVRSQVSPYEGARVRALRREAGICIEHLATAAGISPTTVRNAESGNHQPRPRVAKALARTLGVSLREITPAGPALALRDVRCRLGLTQAEMAARIGVVRQMVSQVERGVTGVRSPLPEGGRHAAGKCVATEVTAAVTAMSVDDGSAQRCSPA